MKRNLFTISFLCLCVLGVYAAPVTQSEALQKARAFLSKRAANGAMYAPIAEQNYTLAYSCTDIANEDAPNGVFSAETPFFYIFSGENGGFVIVSGDDRTPDILGYSHSSIFNADNMPDNMRWFLSTYAEQIVSLGEDDGTMPRYRAPESPTGTTSVAPLIQTKWGQGYPFNKFCPPFNPNGQNNHPSGCVATAMAQIMNYYKRPVRGTGSHSYILYPHEIEANFGATTYDWDNMRSTYYSGYLTVEADAVAELMFHCGVSVNMCYGCSEWGSGALSSAVPPALRNHFGYERDVQYILRSGFTDAQWHNMLRTELDAGRPVYYSGRNNQNGHAFICDGYDDNNRFHFNWGWDGYADGYFFTGNLNPSGPQAGHFNFDQAAVIGIKPIGGPGVNLVCNSLQADGMLVRNQTSNFSFSITNTGEEDYNSLIALDIASSATNLQNIFQENTKFIGAGTTEYFNAEKVITLPVGSYFSVIYYRIGSSSNWHPLYSVPVMVVANSTVNIDLTCNYVQQTDLEATLRTGETGYFKAGITNNSAVDYNSKIIFELMRWNNNPKQIISQVLSQDVQNIPAGEMKEILFDNNITVSPGDYFLVVKYDKSNSSGNDLDILSYTQVAVTGSVGLSNNEFVEVVLFPNPVTEQLFVKSDENIKHISIFDVSGRVMSSNKVAQTGIVSVDVSSLASGMYLLRAETDKGSKTMKFYKK